MKSFIKALFVLFFYASSLSAGGSEDYSKENQNKLYFTSNDVEISNNLMLIHLDDYTIETRAIRTDSQGFYILEQDISDYSMAQKEWKCPYCYRWWPVGQKCGNKDCPSKYLKVNS